MHQFGERLVREGVPFGVYQANHWNKNRQANIQVCSIDTLYRRRTAPPAVLVVIDEAHFAISDSFKWLSEEYKDAFFLCVTATPYPKKSLKHVAEIVVKPITIQELIDQGHLVDARYFAPGSPDLTNVDIDSKTKDYNLKQLNAACDQMNLVGDVVSHYKRICPDVSAICFAVTKAHSKHLMETFLANGVSAVHIEDKTKDTERKEILRAHEAGDIKVICNVGILCTGVDMPWLRAVIMARPTRSKILFIQQAGRGTRPFPNKDKFFLLDHAGNIARHGFITDEHEAELDGQERRAPRTIELVTCENCYCIFEASAGRKNDLCPECGAEKTKQPRELDVQDGELVEIQKIEKEKVHIDAIVSEDKTFNKFVSNMIKKAYQKDYAPGWVYHQIKLHPVFGPLIIQDKALWKRIKIFMPQELRNRKPRAAPKGNPSSDRLTF